MTNIRCVTVMMMLLLEKVIESHSQLVSLQSPLVGTALGWWSGKKLVFGCDSTFCVEIVCFLFKRFVTYHLFTSRFSYNPIKFSRFVTLFLGHSFGWMVGWVGGWSWYWVGTHRVEFLLENMNGASPLFQLSLLLPLIQSADGQNPGDHAGTRVFPLVWQKKDLLYGVDRQNIQFKLPSISLWFLYY